MSYRHFCTEAGRLGLRLSLKLPHMNRRACDKSDTVDESKTCRFTCHRLREMRGAKMFEGSLEGTVFPSERMVFIGSANSREVFITSSRYNTALQSHGTESPFNTFTPAVTQAGPWCKLL